MRAPAAPVGWVVKSSAPSCTWTMRVRLEVKTYSGLRILFYSVKRDHSPDHWTFTWSVAELTSFCSKMSSKTW